MRLKTFVGSTIISVMPIAASASTSVQSEAPLSASVLFIGTALVAVAAFILRRKA